MRSTSDISWTIIYKKDLDLADDNATSTSRTILAVPELNVDIQYDPMEDLVRLRWTNSTRADAILYVNKVADRRLPSNRMSTISIDITMTRITSYVNCEFIDEELLVGTSTIIENLLKRINNDKQLFYNRQSTLILFNQSIDSIAANLYCSNLDRQHDELLPDKLIFRFDVMSDNVRHSFMISYLENLLMHLRYSSIGSMFQRTMIQHRAFQQ
jgi:hypothetical protein